MQIAFGLAFVASRAAIATLSFGALAITSGEASAVSGRVKVACAADYFAYCSNFAVGSSELRQCMRTNGSKLSGRCVNALVAEGEVSEAEVARREAKLR